MQLLSPHVISGALGLGQLLPILGHPLENKRRASLRRGKASDGAQGGGGGVGGGVVGGGGGLAGVGGVGGVGGGSFIGWHWHWHWQQGAGDDGRSGSGVWRRGGGPVVAFHGYGEARRRVGSPDQAEALSAKLDRALPHEEVVRG